MINSDAFVRAGVLAFGVLFGLSAWAVPIQTSGGVDSLLAATTLGNSGENTEKTWIAGQLGVSVADLDYTKYDDGTRLKFLYGLRRDPR